MTGLPTRSGPNHGVSGAAPGSFDHLPGYYETGKDKGGAVFFTDLAFAQPRERDVSVAEPEPLKKVRVLPPYGVSHEGTRYFPDSIAEVPESVAAKWIKSQWAVSEDPEEVISDAGNETRRRGRRPKPQ